MGDLLFYLAAFVFVIALIILGGWVWRSLIDKGVAVPGAAMFTAAKDKRIGAIETAAIDGKRKLVLIRRDGVEHLIMTGGPVDVVIETGIEHAQARSYFPATTGGYGEEGQEHSASLEKRIYDAGHRSTETATGAND